MAGNSEINECCLPDALSHFDHKNDATSVIKKFGEDLDAILCVLAGRIKTPEAHFWNFL